MYILFSHVRASTIHNVGTRSDLIMEIIHYVTLRSVIFLMTFSTVRLLRGSISINYRAIRKGVVSDFRYSPFRLLHGSR